MKIALSVFVLLLLEEHSYSMIIDRKDDERPNVQYIDLLIQRERINSQRTYEIVEHFIASNKLNDAIEQLLLLLRGKEQNAKKVKVRDGNKPGTSEKSTTPSEIIVGAWCYYSKSLEQLIETDKTIREAFFKLKDRHYNIDNPTPNGNREPSNDFCFSIMLRGSNTYWPRKYKQALDSELQNIKHSIALQSTKLAKTTNTKGAANDRQSKLDMNIQICKQIDILDSLNTDYHNAVLNMVTAFKDYRLLELKNLR